MVDWYVLGFVVTWLVTFIGGWTICTINYGFLLGFGLGWLASAIAATIAGVLWPLVSPLFVLWVATFFVSWVLEGSREESGKWWQAFVDRIAAPVMESLSVGSILIYLGLLVITAVYVGGTCIAGWEAPTKVDAYGREIPILTCPFLQSER